MRHMLDLDAFSPAATWVFLRCMTAAWGDGQSSSYDYPAGTTSFSATHIYPDDDPWQRLRRSALQREFDPSRSLC
jgi:hypothetical protein